MITYGSVCSGIEAASVAWEGLGWRAAWFAEIEKFPAAVLAHRYSDVPNLGDMTKIAAGIRAGFIYAPAIMVGGTPCQAFSIAGIRKSLNDPRGQLTLAYVDLANAIDEKRVSNGEHPAVHLWENVPGSLVTDDNAFGYFLAGMVGEDEPFEPGPRPEPGKHGKHWRWKKTPEGTSKHVAKWPKSGCVYGRQRRLAWRILDAQHFGVPQRRRRIFVIASARNDFDPAEVLLEFDGVRRNSAPRGKQEEDATSTLASRTNESGDHRADINCNTGLVPVSVLTANGVGVRGVDDNQAQAGHLIPVAFGGGNCSGELSVAACLTAKGQRNDFDVETFAVHAIHGTQDPDLLTELAHTLGRNQGQENALLTLSSNELSSIAVRRLTPKECERLQGFPDGWTLIPGKKRNELAADELLYLRMMYPNISDDEAHRLAADCPRYKAIGNSMAVPVMKWIGERIAKQIMLVAEVAPIKLAEANKEPLVVSFSGGLSSAFLCAYLIKNYSDVYQFHFVFANTGREHEETLIFADKVDKHFGLNLVWLEGVTSAEHGVGMRHRIVTFETASRNGEPFEQFISVEGIPNVSRQKCSDYLKTQTIRSWMRSVGLARRGWSAKTAIGMRADEPERASMDKASTKRFNLVYPLCHWGSFDKQDVNDFWEDMPFTLNIPPHYGNCLTCFKKSDAKLFLIAHEHPEWFAWNRDMEDQHGLVKATDGHTWWRKKRNTDQLINEAQLEDKQRLIYLTKTRPDDGDGCTSSCEPFQNVDAEIFDEEIAADGHGIFEALTGHEAPIGNYIKSNEAMKSSTIKAPKRNKSGSKKEPKRLTIATNRAVFKWAGGKFKELDAIAKHMPKGERLIEPFVGGGSVFLNLDYPRYLCADFNGDLINAYTMIQQRPDQLLLMLRECFTNGNTRDYFESVRLRFNDNETTLPALNRAVDFIYLNRHCFNGLMRYNLKGKFNVSFGRYKKPYLPEPELAHCLQRSSRTEYLHAPFATTISRAGAGDVVYCDPPYEPQEDSAGFTAYATGRFTMADQTDLVLHLKAAYERGAKVVVTNSNAKKVVELYGDHGFVMHTHRARRCISSKGSTRKYEDDIIATLM